MLNRIFPKTFDNSYRGHWLGIALFVPIVLGKAIQGVESIFNTRNVLVGADGIPLDRFDAAGAATVLAMFALLGFYLLILPLQSLVALIRYRAMIPFLYLMLLIVQLGSRLLLTLNPIARTGTPIGIYVNLIILGMTVLGFALSLTTGKR